jgi:uncharacterized C2H2 Zn-finger protein
MATPLPPDLDELTRYIFHSYAWLMTLEEKAAYKALMLEQKADHSSKDLKAHLHERMEFDNPQVAKLLEGDAVTFVVTTRDRILRDHAGEVFLNRCPKCSALARTPKACLCPACSHTWYETRQANVRVS